MSNGVKLNWVTVKAGVESVMFPIMLSFAVIAQRTSSMNLLFYIYCAVHRLRRPMKA